MYTQDNILYNYIHYIASYHAVHGQGGSKYITLSYINVILTYSYKFCIQLFILQKVPTHAPKIQRGQLCHRQLLYTQLYTYIGNLVFYQDFWWNPYYKPTMWFMIMHETCTLANICILDIAICTCIHSQHQKLYIVICMPIQQYIQQCIYMCHDHLDHRMYSIYAYSYIATSIVQLFIVIILFMGMTTVIM